MEPIALPALTQPRVSVVICNYNYGRFLETALKSALEQSYPCEVVVVDDGSTDESRDILARWQSRPQPRLKVILQANGGQRSAYQTGLANSHGDVVVFLDSDDALMPTAVASIAESFGADVVKVHYRLSLVDEDGRTLGSEIPTRLSEGDMLRRLLDHGQLYASAPGSGNAYRRSVLTRLFPLPIDGADRHGADFFCIYGSIVFGHVRAIERPLGLYRVQRSKAGSDGFTFGNVASRSDLRLRFARREQQLRQWLSERTGGQVIVPKLHDFSHAKTMFVQAVFGSPYFQGLREGGTRLPDLLDALWHHPDFSVVVKTGLSAWALAVLLSPRLVGQPLARYVSNPASRGTRAKARLATA